MPPSNFIDLTGKRFGRLVVIKRIKDREKENKQHTTFWECECDCGNITIVSSRCLNSGKTTSCGCFHKEQSSIKNKKHNQYNFDYKDKICAITDVSNNTTIIDLDDYDKIKDIYWFQNKDGYWVGRKFWKSPHLKLHRFIINANKELVVDHKNHNPQDNRKSNLRQCSIKQNIRNSRRKSKNSSGEKGVGIKNGKYYAKIQYEKKQIYLKQFDTLEEAKYARAIAEDILFEEFSSIDWSTIVVPENSV